MGFDDHRRIEKVFEGDIESEVADERELVGGDEMEVVLLRRVSCESSWENRVIAYQWLRDTLAGILHRVLRASARVCEVCWRW